MGSTTSTTAFALTAFIAWSLFLLVLMEGLRTRWVLTKQIQSNEFRPDNSNLTPFMQRLARAHANCVEGLPIFGGLLLVALVTGNQPVTDSLALVFLGARIAQSVIHMASMSVMAVNLRFTAFVVQMGIAVSWAVRLLAG